MRQNSKNNRGRSRGGRKGPNPLTRSYESNGPDGKVRGTAQHVAEKYMALARDAISSGDNVVAENYYQHAEHYNRIIMTAQAQQNAAREEERRQHVNTQIETEQPRINGEPSGQDDDQPYFHDRACASDPVISQSEEMPRESVRTECADQPKVEEQVKTRRRRYPSKTRQRKVEEAPAETKKSETSNTIVDNPPAFLFNE